MYTVLQDTLTTIIIVILLISNDDESGYFFRLQIQKIKNSFYFYVDSLENSLTSFEKRI